MVGGAGEELLSLEKKRLQGDTRAVFKDGKGYHVKDEADIPEDKWETRSLNYKEDGFYHFFNKHDSDAADQNSTISNAIMAAAGFGLAGLAFLLVVR